MCGCAVSRLTHDQLVEKARAWLRRQGCRVILHDPFRTPLAEQPDAIGWREGVSILVEAKTSIADFRADAKKPFRIEPHRGIGDWRFFITPPQLLANEQLPEGWGLIEADARRTAVVVGGPKGNSWWRSPFKADCRAERYLLVSALAQPEARPRPPASPRRGIDIEAWVQQLASEMEEAGERQPQGGVR